VNLFPPPSTSYYIEFEWDAPTSKEITAMMQADDIEILKLSPTLRAAFEEGELKGELRGAESERQELLSEAFRRANWPCAHA
jgi:hypothetical protein